MMAHFHSDHGAVPQRFSHLEPAARQIDDYGDGSGTVTVSGGISASCSNHRCDAGTISARTSTSTISARTAGRKSCLSATT